MKEKNVLQISGGLVFWTVRGDTNVDKLAAGLKAMDLEHLAPERTPFTATLKDALEYELGSATRLVRPLKSKDGFAVVDEERGEHRNKYTPVVTAQVDDGGKVTFTDSTLGKNEHAEILGTFEEFKDQLKPSQVTSTMVKVVTMCSGIALRPSGALYFLPEKHMAVWRKLAEVVESAGNNDCYLVRAPMDKDTLKAVRDGITSDTMGAAKVIEEEVENGELGERALKTRVEQAKALRDRIAEYESLLNTTLAELREAVDVAENAAATAVLLASAKAEKAAAAEKPAKRAA